MRIPKPFLPVRVESENLNHTVYVVDREYTFGPNGLLTSVKSQGHELLAGPMRIVAVEAGEPSVFHDDYDTNESESFIQRRNDREVVICGAMESERLLINTCQTISYDGNIDIDFKLLTSGYTAAQQLGLEEIIPKSYELNQLWLEVPMKKEACTLFHMYRNSAVKLSDGTVRPMSTMSSSGNIPEQDMAFPFKPIFWLGDEERGFGWFADNDRNWQPIDSDTALEVIHNGDEIVLRIRLLDSHPKAWSADFMQGEGYRPISFHFGFQATPVKPFPKQPYVHKAFHIDCGTKIKGSYADFFAADNHFDRLKEKGVDTLILHEKWNKCQNWFDLSEPTAQQLSFIVEECHKRGIKVLTYFGYEIATIAECFTKDRKEMAVTSVAGSLAGGWWRVPYQKDYVVCNNSGYARYFLDGIENLMDTFHIDGVYLDGTALPRYCQNVEHGCGWYDTEGKIHGSYPVTATRTLFRELYDIVSARDGHINVHCANLLNFTALPYIHQTWYGENLQAGFLKGTKEDVNLEYFRAEYIGRNMGVPVEFIKYARSTKWTFENALGTSILHGILPRPTDIEHPLDVISEVWKIFDNFPIEQSQWCPYWTNGATADHEKLRISYYKYTTLSGKAQLLAFVTNISCLEIEGAKIAFPENVSTALDLTRKCDAGFTLNFAPYDYKILFVE